MLENLEPANKIESPKDFRPAVVFDGNDGVATTEGLPDAPNFDDFLAERGYSPDEYEVVGTPRTSQWQRWDGEWLTSYRFHFRKKAISSDLPTLYAEAKKTKKPKLAKLEKGRAFVVVPSDFQVGKTGSRGGTKELIERVFESYVRIETEIKKGKYERIVIIDGGDIIESVSNAADQQQLATNDLSPMQSVDMAASLMWDLIKMCAKYAPITYGSVASNHCQFRHNKQMVGRPGIDDWGIVILQQLRRLSSEVGLDVEFLIPQPDDEGFAFDVFGDGAHVIGCIHGHQARQPDRVPDYWRKNTFGSQYLAAANILVTGHFHHTRVQELGQAPSGGSRWWVQASTMDSGSDWFRRISGEDSLPAITCFELQKGVYYQGEVKRL
tara:strand:- start:2088 stop:3233 length:1146 start_codon:yes stop_codon:yes gene_type:complete